MWKFLTDDRMWSWQKPGNVSVRDGHLIVAVKYEEAKAMHHKVAGIITSGVSFSAS